MHPNPDRHLDEPPARWQQRLTQLAFVLASALVIARATVMEILRDPFPAAPGGQAAPRTAGATTALVLDLLLCLPALLVLARRVLDRHYRLQLSLSHALFAGLALWSAISPVWASDKFMAAITSMHLVAAAALLWAMTQLVRSWLRLRLVAAVCFAILLVYLAQGTIYRLVDVPDNIRYWEQNKAEELARRGWEPDSFQAMQFEQKLVAGEMIGFNASPNTFAATIVLMGIVAAGAAIQRIRDHDEPGWPAAIIAVLLVACWIIYHTHSRTAFATPVIATGILAAMALAGGFLARRRQILYFAAAVVIVLVAAAAVAHGIHHGSLFHDSLTFRWRYWVGAARIFEQHPILGVGWSNFGSHYLGVRLPIASEEVKDPHNLFARAFVELGTIGGALMVAWVARLWWELTSPGMPQASQEAEGRTALAWRPAEGESQSTGSATMKTVLAICGCGIIVNILASVDFGLDAPGASWYISLELFKRLLFFGLLVLGFSMAALRSSQEPRLDERPAPWALWAIIAALAAFFVHNLLDFSLFEAGPMALFAFLAGSALAARSSEDAPPDGPDPASRWQSLAALGATLALWLAVSVGVLLPVGIAEATARGADELIRQGRFGAAGARFRNAFTSLWIPNADYAYRAAVALQQEGQAPEQVRAMYDAAIEADPMSVLYRRARAEFALHGPSADPKLAIADFEKVIGMNPNDVAARIDFAQVLAELGQRQRAIEEYREALRFNDLLHADEPKRLKATQIRDIRGRIAALGG